MTQITANPIYSITLMNQEDIPKAEFNADKALEDPSLDQLGYVPLAISIANGIKNMKPAEGIVMAVTGEWGSGKTTTINFIKHSLEPSSIEIVDFNPWWFAGHDDLARQLLNQIKIKVDPNNPKKKELSKTLDKLANAVDKSPVQWKPSFMGVSFDPAKALKKVGWNQKSHSDVPALKRHAASLLKDLGTHLLVVVDDLDRLSVEEILDLFRAVKAIGNLPNVTYLLAFDDEIVSQALQKNYHSKANDYLSKIVQISFTLPRNNNNGIYKLFIARLELLLEQYKIDNFDTDRFISLYEKGLQHMLTTPRHAIRLLNALRITLPSLHREVNVPDLVAIEAIRINLPKLFELISNNKEHFVGVVSVSSKSGFDDELKEFHNNWISKYPDQSQEWIKQFSSELFPKLDLAWRNTYQSNSYLKDWRKNLRVSSIDIFDVYFRFTVPSNTISAVDLNAFLARVKTGNVAESLAKKLSSSSSKDKAWIWNLLERLSDHTDDFDSHQAEDLLLNLINQWTLYSKSDEETPKIPWLHDNNYLLVNLLINLVKRIDHQKRKDSILESMKRPFSVYAILSILVEVGQAFGFFLQHSNSSRPEALLKEDEFFEITKVFFSKVSDLLEEGTIKDSIELTKLIYFAEELDPELCQELVESYKSFNLGLVALVSFGLTESKEFGKSDIHYKISLEKIEELIQPGILRQPSQKAIADQALDNRSTNILKAFIEALNSVEKKQEGF